MNVQNLPELHRLQAERLGSDVAVRYKRHGLYRDLAWMDYRAQVEACAAALIAAGVAPGQRVGLLSENRVEWLIADVAIMAAGAVNVPLHAPLTAAQCRYQLQDAGASWLFVSTSAQLEKVRVYPDTTAALHGLVVFEPITGAAATTWRSFLQHGRALQSQVHEELQRRERQLAWDDLATIMYTSGTTGNPKGVMLTHGNVLSNVEAFHQGAHCGPASVFLNWLPFSHIYARTVDHYHSLWTGSVLCLAESADTVVQNLAEIEPTHMSSVPRFYEKLLTAVTSADAKETGRRLRKIFGPRVDWLGSGGAPLPPAIAQAYHDAGLILIQGYGLTESAPVISFNRKDRFRIESVGPPLPNVEVKIAADGELLTRGPHVMKGYWNNPQATAEALMDGWLHTGDLGRLDDDGFLHITGRKKDLIVLSNGKKVAPALVEGKLLADPLIDQAVVYGDNRNFLAALIVPHWANIKNALAESEPAEFNTPEEALATRAAVVRLLAKHVDIALSDLAPWEQVKKFVILHKPFSVAADELTVSQKLRRKVIFVNHMSALEALYRE